MNDLLKWTTVLSLALALPLTACEKNEPVGSDIIASGKTDCSLSDTSVCFPYMFDVKSPHVHDEILAWFVTYSSSDNGMRSGGQPEPLATNPDTLNRFMSELNPSSASEMRSKAIRNCYPAFNVEPEMSLNEQEEYDACVEQIKSAAVLGDGTMLVLNAMLNPDFSMEGFESEIRPIAEKGNEVGLIMMIEVAEEMDKHDEFEWLKKAWLSGNSRAGSAILNYRKMREQLKEKEAIRIFETVFASTRRLPSDNLKSVGIMELVDSLSNIDNFSLETQIAILSAFKTNFPEFSDDVNLELDQLKD